MPNVEIDEVELTNLRRLQGVAAKIVANPKAKALLEQAHKTVDANAPTPTLDLEKAASEPLHNLTKQINDLQAQIAKDKEDRESASKLAKINSEVEAGFAALREQGWQEDGIKKVDELMKQKGILDPLIAAAAVEKTMPKPEPVTPSGTGSWDFIAGVQDGEADLKKLIESKGNSESIADKMARDALNEVRGQSRR